MPGAVAGVSTASGTGVSTEGDSDRIKTHFEARTRQSRCASSRVSVPRAVANGSALQYEIVDPANDKFKIWSNGPDQQPGSSDDIATTL